MNKRIQKYLAVLLMTLVASQVFAQTSITGVVKDEINGETIPGATVIVKGTTNGTVTDLDGRYTLNISDAAEAVIISFVGYEVMELPINGRSVIDASLAVSMTELTEVVVIGYGTQSKKVVTGAIASVSAKQIESTPILRVEQALQGRTAGVQVTNLSGQPGDAPTVRIRGAGTTGDANPIYVVDGMVVGGIDYLNPGDIESMDVLKDAASAAIYGARAANGVVLITTKSGVKGQMNVTYSGYYGIQNAAKKIDMLNAEEYRMMQNEGARNGGLDEPFDLAQLPAHDTDWQEEMFTKNAPISNHQIQISGGSEKSSFTTSISAFSQQGIIGGEKSQFDRYTARFNSRQQVTSWLDFGNNLAYTRKTTRGISSNTSFGGAYSSALNIDPLTPVTEQDPDILSQSPYSSEPVLYADNGFPYGISTNVGSEIVNPLALIDNQHGEWNEDKLVGGVFAEFQPIKGLKIRTAYSIDLAIGINSNFTPIFYLNGSQGNLERTSVTKEAQRWFNWQWDNTITYSKKLGDHNFAVLVGTSAQERTYENIGGSKDKAPLLDYDHVYIDQAQDTVANAWGGATEDALSSYFGRVTYDFKDRYSFTAILRRDGSSKFGDNNKYGYFPSLGVAWVLSDEAFMQSLGPINLLKFRASWGINGNESIPRFRYASPMNYTRGYTLGSGYTVGASPAYAANADIQWEESNQIDLAIDFGLLDNRLTGTVDVYNKTTNKLLYNPAIQPHAGIGAPYQNVGSVENKGIEMSLNFRNAAGELSYSIGANATYNKNTMTKIDGTGNANIPGASWAVAGPVTNTIEGEPISYFYGYKTDGIFQSNAEVFQHIGPGGEPLQSQAVPGDVRFVDLNNDGVIDDKDRTNIGNPTPDWTFGLNGSLDFKGIDFSFLFTGSLGNDIFAGQQRRDLRYTNMPTDMLDRWTPENPSTSTPRFTWTDTNNNNRVSDLYIEDGSYLRLKNIQLGYTLPNSILDRIGANTWRFYVSAENVITLTNYSGADPEIGAISAFDIAIDRGVYPQARTFRVGTSITF
ncbi:TonB-linked outer membrane protein, SusC/RagA family [Reichenbachiella agariperforans]|uniref:TonB-linked outer membrane protein, SusC/RagA family n=1 Tax=Reichenbachiella agariperforans TaxID=156994 RepID=A0A1M6Q0U5_REIAG|nr:TonB-dependent receptor [Reichenbachiella agariperforans]SHK13736.1 TonB-linked outer membrane protein, SusC/RagA family [Reichenbachiella agariperforans]